MKFRLNRVFGKEEWVDGERKRIDIYLYLDSKKETEKAYCLKIDNIPEYIKYLPKSQVTVHECVKIFRSGKRKDITILEGPEWLLGQLGEYSLRDYELESIEIKQ